MHSNWNPSSGTQVVQPPRKTIQWFRKKLNTLTIPPSNPIPGYFLQRNEADVYSKIYLKMFLVTLLMISKKRKQPKYPSIDE